MTPNSENGMFESLRLELRRGCLIVAVLAQLRHEHYGYTLRKALADEGLAIEESTLYPLLRRLETQGLLKSEWREEDKRNKRFYRLSGEGEVLLEQLLVEWNGINESLHKILKENRGKDMNLLERYLQAVAQYLAPGTREDVLAELRVNLEAEMDARAEEKQGPLTESEAAAILKAHGRPMLVAARYMPQHYLIGPEVFPFYLLTLRKAAPLVVLLYFVAHVARFIFAPNPGAFAASMARSFAQLVPVLLIFWGSVTLTFAILEYVHRQHGQGAGWNDLGSCEAAIAGASHKREVPCHPNCRPRGALSLDVVRVCDSAPPVSDSRSGSALPDHAVRGLWPGVAPLLHLNHRSIAGTARHQAHGSCSWKAPLGGAPRVADKISWTGADRAVGAHQCLFRPHKPGSKSSRFGADQLLAQRELQNSVGDCSYQPGGGVLAVFPPGRPNRTVCILRFGASAVARSW